MSLILLAAYATLLALGLAGYFRMERRHMERHMQRLEYSVAVVEDAANTTTHAANKAWHDAKGVRR